MPHTPPFTAPTLAAPILTGDDRARIAAAVASAEAGCDAEIVTILADHSDTYDDIALVWSALVALLALIALSVAPHFFLALVERVMGWWQTRWSPGAVITLAATIATVKFLATYLLLLWRPLRLALVPGPIKRHRVHARARACYRIGAQHRSDAGRTVLIYLSRAERRAEIIADPDIAAKVPATEWNAAMAAICAHCGDGRLGDGMVEAIARIGAVLAQHFPASGPPAKQLPDTMIEL